MHNLKEIRKDFDNFKKSLEKRSIETDISNLEKLDKKNRELIQKKESLEQEKKEISKSKDKSMFEKYSFGGMYILRSKNSSTQKECNEIFNGVINKPFQAIYRRFSRS